MKPDTCKAAGLLTLFTLLLAAALTLQPQDANAEIMNPQQPVSWSNPAVVHNVQDVAAGFRRELRKAKREVDSGGFAAAQERLWSVHEQGNRLIRTPALLPLSTARRHAGAGDWDALHHDLMPLMGEVSAIEVFAPRTAKKLQSDLQSAETATRNGNTREAYDHLQSADQRINAITSYLPLHYIDGQVYAAIDALRQSPVQNGTAARDVGHALEALSVFHDPTANPQG